MSNGTGTNNDHRADSLSSMMNDPASFAEPVSFINTPRVGRDQKNGLGTPNTGSKSGRFSYNSSQEIQAIIDSHRINDYDPNFGRQLSSRHKSPSKLEYDLDDENSRNTLNLIPPPVLSETRPSQRASRQNSFNLYNTNHSATSSPAMRPILQSYVETSQSNNTKSMLNPVVEDEHENFDLNAQDHHLSHDDQRLSTGNSTSLTGEYFSPEDYPEHYRHDVISPPSTSPDHDHEDQIDENDVYDDNLPEHEENNIDSTQEDSQEEHPASLAVRDSSESIDDLLEAMNTVPVFDADNDELLADQNPAVENPPVEAEAETDNRDEKDSSNPLTRPPLEYTVSRNEALTEFAPVVMLNQDHIITRRDMYYLINNYFDFHPLDHLRIDPTAFPKKKDYILFLDFVNLPGYEMTDKLRNSKTSTIKRIFRQVILDHFLDESTHQLNVHKLLAYANTKTDEQYYVTDNKPGSPKLDEDPPKPKFLPPSRIFLAKGDELNLFTHAKKTFQDNPEYQPNPKDPSFPFSENELHTVFTHYFRTSRLLASSENLFDPYGEDLYSSVVYQELLDSSTLRFRDYWVTGEIKNDDDVLVNEVELSDDDILSHNQAQDASANHSSEVLEVLREPEAEDGVKNPLQEVKGDVDDNQHIVNFDDDDDLVQPSLQSDNMMDDGIDVEVTTDETDDDSDDQYDSNDHDSDDSDSEEETTCCGLFSKKKNKNSSVGMSYDNDDPTQDSLVGNMNVSVDEQDTDDDTDSRGNDEVEMAQR